MKINFWQIVGLVLVLLGVAGIVYREFFTTSPTPTVAPQQPTTAPTTQTLPLAARSISMLPAAA